MDKKSYQSFNQTNHVQEIKAVYKHAPLLYNHIYFVVRAEVFHGIIVASPSCTEYHWGTLIALYRAVL